MNAQPHAETNPWDRCYTVKVQDHTMTPRYRPGDTLYVEPGGHVEAGHDCLVWLGKAKAGIPRLLVSKTESEIVLEQYRPRRQRTFPIGEVKKIEPIFGSLVARMSC